MNKFWTRLAAGALLNAAARGQTLARRLKHSFFPLLAAALFAQALSSRQARAGADEAAASGADALILPVGAGNSTLSGPIGLVQSDELANLSQNLTPRLDALPPAEARTPEDAPSESAPAAAKISAALEPSAIVGAHVLPTPAPSKILPQPVIGPVSGPAPGASFAARRRKRISAVYRFHRSALKAYRWYNMIHTQGLWTDYRQKIAALTSAGSPPSIKRPRAFFTALRTFGSTGERPEMGYTSALAGKDQVIAEALGVAARHLRGGKTSEAQVALRGFLNAAAASDDPRHSNSHFRKVARNALSEASFKPAAELVPYFQGLRPRPASQALPQDAQDAVRAKLRQTVMETLAEESPRAKDRIVAVVLFGSFANGAASEESDLDLAAVSADGGSGEVKNFAKRLEQRWDDARHPVAFKDDARIADDPSAAYLRRYYRIAYRVIALSAELERDLSPAPETEAAPASGKLSLQARAQRVVMYSGIYGATIYADLSRAARSLAARMGLAW
ncbi:MAG TPA: nucleotidyltransferase domain-containing protein [Elusimicrobiota bacterium]|nr:nucleotidyltransferase domain-containing protein [Elusimicrobiota bacterium]